MSLVIPEPLKIWGQFIHPTIMWVLLAGTIYALYLGIQIRRTRAAEGEAKKELIQGKFNIKHYQVGSILLAAMVLTTLMGMGFTYINNGKLFIGPHLLLGLGMTGIIATSAALSPYMQKGNDWARYTHIALNVTLLGLFGWQAVTGMQILVKIIDKISKIAS
ncbi:hypothetical protein BCD67_23470 [Oscillatoriales cyanobacterium USR001]|nr:hypothetical protein BCD67_23470 [Oscillatoriales cyanobacterium USR001]